jgi:RAB protein geranylgeranyltransferase component A
LARGGKSVLHWEPKERYGGEFGSFWFREIIENNSKEFQFEFIKRSARSTSDEGYSLDASSRDAEDSSKRLISIEQPCEEDEQPCEEDEKQSCSVEAAQLLQNWGVEPFDKEFASLLDYCLTRSKCFNIELNPKLLFSKGEIIELVIKSGVGHSLEFQMPNLLVFQDGIIKKTPGSKEDIFCDDSISLIDKRRLMKFLTFALEFDVNDKQESKNLESVLFCDFLKNQKIPSKLVDIIITSIALEVDIIKVMEMDAFRGIIKVKEHLNSIGRFGPRAFLTAVYGTSSELCQAFCRYSAIHGANYILGHDPNIEITKECIKILGPDNHLFTGKHLFVGSNNLSLINTNCKQIKTKRIICISRKPFLDGGHSMLMVPANISTKEGGMTVVQYTYETRVCPQDLFLVHIWSPDTNISFEKLVSLASQLAKDSFLSVKYFTNTNVSLDAVTEDKISIIQPCSNDIIAEEAVLQARQFYNIFGPPTEFYPLKINTDSE